MVFVLKLAGHQLHLISDAPHGKWEKEALLSTMVTFIRATVLQRRLVYVYCRRKGIPIHHGCKPTPNRRLYGHRSMSTPRLTSTVKARRLQPELVPDINNIMHCVSKMFASQGDHGNYYLNEYLSLLAWKNAPLPAAPASTTSAATATETATETAIREAVAAAGAALNKANKLVTLPSVKSSRQINTTELAAAIMCNIPDYAEYAHDHRVEADPNKLVNVVWNGVRDRYAKAGLYSRGLRFVLINAPARFVIKSLTDRCNLFKIMGIIRSTIVQLGEIRERCFLGNRDWRPSMDMLKINILEAFPQWADKFDKLEENNRKYHQRVYEVGRWRAVV